jgi:hypothetical protein
MRGQLLQGTPCLVLNLLKHLDVQLDARTLSYLVTKMLVCSECLLKNKPKLGVAVVQVVEHLHTKCKAEFNLQYPSAP